MNDFPKLAKKYDHVIVGYNLASMTFAYELKKRDLDFVIIDAKHLGSSPIKRLASIEKRVATRISFNPDFEVSEDDFFSWGTLSKAVGTPTTFDKGEFKSFLGFGDKKIDSLDATQAYCTPESVTPQLKVEELWDKVLESTENRIFLDQQVTDILYSEEGVEKLILNGKTSLGGSHFYFFDHFNFLIDKIAAEIKKLASQFAKLKWRSSVNLIVHHTKEPKAFEFNELYLLMGSKEQPCLGQFLTLEGHLVSRWESFFPAEMAADAEMTGAMVKEIKKQIKRAFDFPEDSKSYEHVLVHERVFADFEKVSMENGPISHFQNLFAFSPLFAGNLGWMQEVQTGRAAAQMISEMSDKKETQIKGPLGGQETSG